ncbi:MAG: Piwi domain-containing protein [Kiritimatiellae bacterium]|nr:Piwi domain-containing protein [Kiritimatiellia bacterium]
MPSSRSPNSREFIALNLMPITPQAFNMTVYRRAAERGDQKPLPPEVKQYRLPPSIASEDEFVPFDVSLAKRDGFDAFACDSTTNWYLTLWYIANLLNAKSAEALPPDSYLCNSHFGDRIAFVLDQDALGQSTVELQPYYLRSEKLLGFLVGHHFRVAPGVAFDRRVQQRSLSLDQSFGENKDYYADQYGMIERFLKTYQAQLFPITLPDGTRIDVDLRMARLPAERLRTKTYVFAGNTTASSQFMGVKSRGPLRPLNNDSLICFMYRPADKPLSHDLYRALRGDTYGTFKGMNDMFQFSLGTEHVIGVPLDGFDKASLDDGIARMKGQIGSRTTLPLILFPWSRLDPDPAGKQAYYQLKHCFLSHGFPTQLVSLRKLRDRESMKWSIANIALGVFSKLGGVPWMVQPQHQKCLIIGVGQCHRRSSNGAINRYYAYSVLTDSTGIYDSIRTLIDERDEGSYLNGLTESIKQVLNDYRDQYDRFVIHTAFRLRRAEMKAIHAALDQYGDEDNHQHDLVALKFNDRNRFFGFATWNNSKVPYESTYISLSQRERLVWFEGLQYHNPTIRSRIGGPMHVELTYPHTGIDDAVLTDYLQDALNLSGANWRGFNSKSMPVSVYYAKLIADYVGRFDEYGFPDLRFDGLPPWFL